MATERTRDLRAARVRALVSLGCFVVLAVMLGAFLARHLGAVLLSLGSITLAACGAWWLVARRGAASAWGAVALGCGLAGLVGAIVLAGGHWVEILVRVALAALLLGAAVAAARSAVARAGARDVAASGRHLRPRAAVLLCNPRSGGGKVERFGLLDLAKELGVKTVLLGDGRSLDQLARDAIDAGADCLGMAGGDGSQALVASIAAAHDLPFVCVPAGTRNHFALDLGLDRDDPRKALAAFRDGVERAVDLATVNGRTFVNNVSLGVYATVVQDEEYRDAKAQTTRRILPDALSDPAHAFDLTFTTPDGMEVDDAILVLVSNNPYVLRASEDAAMRRRVDSGTLGVFSVSASSGPQAAAAFLSALSGRRGARGLARQFEVDRFEVRSASTTVLAGVDGEALELRSPLTFRSVPGGLRLLVPEGNVEAAARRAAREWTLADLVGIVAGRHDTDP